MIAILIVMSFLLTGLQLNAKNKTVEDIIVVSFNDYNLKQNPDLVIMNTDDLDNVSSTPDTSVFIQCELEEVRFVNKKLGYNIPIEEEIVHGYDFVGLLMNKYKGSVEKWYIENGVSSADLNMRLKESLVSSYRNNNTRATVGNYSTSIVYPEATVGIACLLMKDGTIGGMSFVVEAVPNGVNGVKYIQPKITSSQGNILAYSPQQRSNYSASVSISYPWGISGSINTDSPVAISIISGGVAYKTIEWRYTPSGNITRNRIYTESVCSFSLNGASTPKCAVRYEIKLSSFANDVETSRIVNYNTNF